MIKILHLADIHLGRTYSKYNVATEMREALEDTLRSAFEYAFSQGVNVILIAGDLFNTNSPELRFKFMLRDLITSANSRGIEVIYILGNHDNISGLQFLSDLKGLQLIGEEPKLYTYTFNGVNVNILGSGFTTEEIDFQQLESLLGTTAQGDINIAGFHGNFLSNSEIIAKMAALNVDFIALGDIHITQNLGRNIYYSGSIMGQDITEVGVKGGILLEFDHSKSEEHRLSKKFIRFSDIIFGIVKVKFDEEVTQIEIAQEYINRAFREFVAKSREIDILSLGGKQYMADMGYEDISKSDKLYIRFIIVGLLSQKELITSEAFESYLSHLKSSFKLFGGEFVLDKSLVMIDSIDSIKTQKTFMAFLINKIEEMSTADLADEDKRRMLREIIMELGVNVKN